MKEWKELEGMIVSFSQTKVCAISSRRHETYEPLDYADFRSSYPGEEQVLASDIRHYEATLFSLVPNPENALPFLP